MTSVAIAGTMAAHTKAAAEVATELGVDPSVGLSTREAALRVAADGSNELEAFKREPVWRMVFDAVAEHLVRIVRQGVESAVDVSLTEPATH